MSVSLNATSPSTSPIPVVMNVSPNQSGNIERSTCAPAVANPYPAPVASISKSIEIGDANISLIDLDAIQRAEGAERKRLIKQFGDALKEVGFLAVKTSETFSSLIEAVNMQMRSYFGQELQDKMRDWHNNNGQTGFSPQGTETAAGAKKADLKETYFIPPNFSNWPDGMKMEEFRATMGVYHKELTGIASQLMGYIGEYVEESTEPVSQSMEAATNLLRLAYYPAARENDDPEAVWAAAHEDLNALTLLPPSEVPGLQLLSKEGHWLSVNAPKGYLIVNTGEQVELKTAGLIKATRHQVLNPGGIYARSPRFASIFFASWSNEFPLSPFEGCLKQMTSKMPEGEKAAYKAQFPNVNVQENLLSRLIEMGAIPNPDEALVRSLRDKGILKKPPVKLIDRFPFLAENL